jgi:4-amino-4-deoxy-L-arabinose transferase-like glycosyltransferase
MVPPSQCGSRRPRQLRQLLPAVLLALNAGILAWEAYLHSPTLNEPAHLVAGISYWQFGRFDVYCVNPPLVRMVAAAPVLLADPKTDWRNFYEGSGVRPEFLLGEDLVAVNGERSAWLFTIARWACIPFSLFGGYLCYCWAKRLYGNTAGLLSLALWCFCPNLLGHGQLITPDVAATALSLAAAYSFWLWLTKPNWTRAVTSGAILGLAELTKMTLIILFPLWLVMWLVYRWQDRRTIGARGWLRDLGMLAVRMAIALYVLNLGYGFKRSLDRLDSFKFVSASLASNDDAEKVPAGGANRFAGTWIGALPVPLPRDYLLGMDMQRRDFENYGLPSYLAGQFSPKGWWYYYLYALAIKVPLGTWLLLLLAAISPFILKRISSSTVSADAASPSGPAGPAARWRDEFVLLCPAITILVFVSSQTGFSEHMRYVLPAFPFAFIWIGRIVPTLRRKHQVLTGVATAALLWSIGSSLAIYPHSLSYFNELVGGPMGGPEHLLQSNVDWGQDLFFLKGWLDKHPEAKPIQLAYFGFCDPKFFGIDYTALQPPTPAATGSANIQIPPGWYAISVNFVRGMPHFSYKGDGTKMNYAQGSLIPFQKLKPTATAGYSIYIYHVSASDAEILQTQPRSTASPETNVE